MRRLLICVWLLGLSNPAFAHEARIEVKGMVCGFCARGIVKKFSHETAVKDVKIDLDNKFVTLVFDDHQSLSEEKIAEILRDAGFTPGEIVTGIQTSH